MSFTPYNEPMEKKELEGSRFPHKLNIKRTMLIGFAFFGILLLWQVYDSWCGRMLSELLAKALYDLPKDAIPTKSQQEGVQYIVGCIMALDNLAALIMLPIFGRLSDRTHTKIGKRMPYILVGTFASAIAFPFIPLFFYWNSLAGTIVMMAIVIFFMMMYRNPAVSLMPDITPKPLRSKANGVINVMGYLGGAVAIVLGLFFSMTKFLGYKGYDGEGNAILTGGPGMGNVWIIELPFLIASIVMIISCLVLFFTIKENQLGVELRGEIEEGEKFAEVADKVEEDAPMTKSNKRMLLLILAAEVFWFMASNGVSTFQANYFTIYLGSDFSMSILVTLVSGVFAVVGFITAGLIADKIGRKWTMMIGLFGVVLSYALFAMLPLFTSFVTPALLIIWAINGYAFSLINTNSFPMVVELCSSKKIGQFTGFYYAASMLAQTITPVALGVLIAKLPIGFKVLPYYALFMIVVSTIIFFFVENVKTKKTTIAKGLEALGDDD